MFSQLNTLFKKCRPVEGWFVKARVPQHFAQHDAALRQHDSFSTHADIDYLARYFATGMLQYTTQPGHIVFPGVPGTRGLHVEGLEGFARSAPILASYLCHQAPTITTLDGKSIDLLTYLRDGINAGVSPTSSSYWGDIEDYDQRLVEASDIAICVFMMVNLDENTFTAAQLTSIMQWLRQANKVKRYGGNWCLFVLVINATLRFLGDQTDTILAQEYTYFKSMYAGHGWFKDGVNGELDYYNVWQMQYKMVWLTQILPDFHRAELIQYNAQFTDVFKHFISPQGIPMYGRSICYRLAIATPFIANAIHDPAQSGLARKVFDITHQYFVQRGACRDARPTQGYFEDAPFIMENYSGRGSSLWSLRALTLMLQFDKSHAFWQAPLMPLPIEQSDYEQHYDALGLHVKGTQETATITVFRSPKRFNVMANAGLKMHPNIVRKIAEYVLRRPLREENFAVKYGQPFYSSHHLLVESTEQKDV